MINGTPTVEFEELLSIPRPKLPSQITVLVTGAGGVATPGLIMHLRNSWHYKVVAVDMDQYAAGLYHADAAYVVPLGGSPDFLPAMRRICERECVDVVVPLVDEELVGALELETDGVRVLLPRREFVQTCLDKFDLMCKLYDAGILVPGTWLAPTTPFLYFHDMRPTHFPLIVKPRIGRGSRGVAVVNSQMELEEYIGKMDASGEYVHAKESLLVQSYIDGTEFTVSVVVGCNGRVYAVVPKEIVCKRGVTRIAVTRHNKDIDTMCRNIQSKLRANGPFNVQLVLDKKSGLPIVFEINPRFSTTTSLTTAAGIDEMGWLIQHAVDPFCSELSSDWKEGVVLLRRTLDEFVDEDYLREHPVVGTSDGAPLC